MDLASLSLIPLVLVGSAGALWLLLLREQGVKAHRFQSRQEIEVVVRGGFRPALVIACRGVPLQLRFVRLEGAASSDTLIFEGFHVNRRLRAFATTEVELLPDSEGDFVFTCGTGAYAGRLIVR